MIRNSRTYHSMSSPVLLLVALLLHGMLSACEDHGLAPATQSESPGFSGIIRVRSAWPPQDSVRDLRIAAFRTYPPKDILSEVLSGTTVFSEELPYGVDSLSYRVQADALSGSFAYVVVAQNYGPDPFKEWRAVGVYTITGDFTMPSPIDLAEGRFLRGIDVEVDFINLPPQPF